MVRQFLIGAAFAVFASSPALAQELPRTRVDPARIAAAQALLDAMHYDRQIERTVDAIIVEVDRSIDKDLSAELSEKLPPELVTRIKGIAETHMHGLFKEHGAELKRGTALIYASHFTVPELHHLAELQSDPVLVKMQDQLPKIAADNMALTQAVISKESDKVREEVIAAVQDYLQKKGSKPTS